MASYHLGPRVTGSDFIGPVSVWTAILKYHRLGSLDSLGSRNLLLMVLETGKTKIRVPVWSMRALFLSADVLHPHMAAGQGSLWDFFFFFMDCNLIHEDGDILMS